MAEIQPSGVGESFRRFPQARDGGRKRFFRPSSTDSENEVNDMFTPSGFYTSQGYVGFLPGGQRMIFATQEDYLDYVCDR